MRFKVLILIGLFSFLAMMATPVVVWARQDPLSDICSGSRANSAVCKKSPNSGGNPIFGPNGVLTKIIQILIIIAGVASVIVIMIGGFKYIVSNGEANNIKSAKDTILFAIIGLVITIIAQTIVSFVIMRL